MCGIAGLLSFEADAARWRAALDRSIALVARRGPDDGGAWGDDACLLGFRRLAVLDLTPAGHQPMLDPSGRFALVCNGEIYNFRELRAALRREGVCFRSTGDAEVALHALIRWGPDALRRFDGMFALAFYDAASRRLLLARDHVGMKPLYYLRVARGLVFGSQYDQILAHPWARASALRSDALGLFLRFDQIPAPYAAHDDAALLEPGAWLAVDATGRTERGRFHDFPRDRAPDLRGDEALEAVEAAVAAAVRRHVVSDVPLGTFLSGGIDSPLVAALARETIGASIPAYTLATGDAATDESADAAGYARTIGLAHTVRRIDERDVLDLVTEAHDACAEPFADYSILPTLAISRLARERVTVMLSGDGGDELFWGYADRSASVLRIARHFREPRLWRAVRHLASRDDWGLLHRTIGDVYRTHHGSVRRRTLRAALPELPPLPDDYTAFDYDGWEEGRTARWMRWLEVRMHLPRILMKVDRASMHHALEVRMPLLDREVVDVASRVDWATCLDATSGVGKRPLRHALARRVPHQTTAKRGFTVPIDAWFRGPLRALFEDAVLGRAEICGVPLGRRALRAMHGEHQRGAARHGWLFWRLLSLSLWAERHGRPTTT